MKNNIEKIKKRLNYLSKKMDLLKSNGKEHTKRFKNLEIELENLSLDYWALMEESREDYVLCDNRPMY